MGSRLQLFRPTIAVLHREHLRENVRQLRKGLDPKTFFCPMVKANAYGHGDFLVAQELEAMGVLHLGVGLVEEGILLRQMGIQAQILVYGVFDQRAVPEIIRWKLTPVVGLWHQLHFLESQVQTDAPLTVHLKFDTGMNRLGFAVQEAESLRDWFRNQKKIQVSAILTHLHSAEDAGSFDGHSFEQLKSFKNVERYFPQVSSHTLNSAGLLHWIRHRMNFAQQGLQLPEAISLQQGVRPGLSIYGYSPLPVERTPVKLKPMMSLRSHLVKVMRIQIGETVSYSATWTAQRASVIGVVPVGYADGYHRLLSNVGQVLVEGHRVPIVGNICMDHLMVDLTEILQGREISSLIGHEVTLLGYDRSGNLISAIELAEKAKTIPWEILTSIGERVPRMTEADP